MSLKRSGLQNDVLNLYRRALRMVNTKPVAARPSFLLFVRYTFHENSQVSPRNVSFIEHLLRKGVRQVELYEDPGVKDCRVSQNMVDWDKSRKRIAQRTT
ncbi:hypothetical protein B0H34DRAFT_443326 [Crassisporium funariophilum]|nr:hypothetical protein B0H34DRAFT_443326 [Crassisporium funariophilum]